MEIKINELALRKVTLTRHLEVGDVFLLVGSLMIVPPLGFVFLGLNIVITAVITGGLSLAFIVKFRLKKRRGYFIHYVDYHTRCKDWGPTFRQRGRRDDFYMRCIGYEKIKRD